ncbi:MAG: hypothetical protein ACFFAO_12370 [Candidatus Hermodarchaeota archaeon]
MVLSTSISKVLKSTKYDESLVKNIDEIKNQIKNSPFLGCFIADKDGKTLFKFEIFQGALDFSIKWDTKNEARKSCLDIELIPMFISALERFSQEINIKDLPGFKLEGKNIKLETLFSFDNYSIIFILNPKVNLNLVKERIEKYFTYLFEVYKEDFGSKLKLSSIAFISHLELLGKLWLEDLNKNYLNLTQQNS